MYLSNHSTHAASGQRTRQRMLRRGVTMRGRKIWTPEEDDLCRELYPHRQRLQAALAHRTLEAIKQRCQRLGLTPKQHAWTAKDNADFKRLYARAPRAELLARFPNHNDAALHTRAWKLGLSRPRRPYRSTGDYLFDALRERCHTSGLSMSDLDAFVPARKYFSRNVWGGGRPRIRHQYIVQAILELGGRIEVTWENEG